ncbi:MAG: cyclic-di-AMP receptor [Ruminococcus sp.]|nr:cyclic-di-AMP receptor [Ruminococcus sp.]MDY3895372.1 cyclic-di-AMP receptor [Candidatus Fimenecus sp.]
MNEMCDKLIIAVLTNDDATEAVHHLNEKGFYATTMSSAGGFLKKGNVTLMVGLNSQRLSEAVDILKRYGKSRMDSSFLPTTGIVGAVSSPVKVQCGGLTAFVLDVDKTVKF